MPVKRGEAKGDLYLVTKIEFPENDWLGQGEDANTKLAALAALLPAPQPEIDAEIIDEVEYDDQAHIEDVSRGP